MGTPLDDLITAEGAVKRNDRHVLYTCPAGKPTIGYGRNLDARGLSEDEARILAVNDIAANVATCIEAFGIEAWNAMLPSVLVEHGLVPATAESWEERVANERWLYFSPRHRALLELAHGLGGFSDFPGFVRAIKSKDFDLAARELKFKDAHDESKGTSDIWTDWRSDRPGEQRLERIMRWLRTNEE